MLEEEKTEIAKTLGLCMDKYLPYAFQEHGPLVALVLCTGAYVTRVSAVVKVQNEDKKSEVEKKLAEEMLKKASDIGPMADLHNIKKESPVANNSLNVTVSNELKREKPKAAPKHAPLDKAFAPDKVKFSKQLEMPRY